MPTATCVHCGVHLRLALCGCYVDRDNSRWCNGDQRHEPEFGTQPETCGAKL